MYSSSVLIYRQYYLYSVVWTDPTHLIVAWCNREQTHSYVNLCTVPAAECVRVSQLDT